MRQLKITKSITNRESASLDKYLQEIGREELITVEEEVELAQRIRKGCDLLSHNDFPVLPKLHQHMMPKVHAMGRKPPLHPLTEQGYLSASSAKVMPGKALIVLPSFHRIKRCAPLPSLLCSMPYKEVWKAPH